MSLGRRRRGRGRERKQKTTSQRASGPRWPSGRDAREHDRPRLCCDRRSNPNLQAGFVRAAGRDEERRSRVDPPRLEAVGLTVESTPGDHHVLRDGKPLRKQKHDYVSSRRTKTSNSTPSGSRARDFVRRRRRSRRTRASPPSRSRVFNRTGTQTRRRSRGPESGITPGELTPTLWTCAHRDPRNSGAAQARFGVTGRSRRPLPRLPRAVLVPPVRADGRTRSAR